MVKVDKTMYKKSTTVKIKKKIFFFFELNLFQALAKTDRIKTNK